ncbi:MAG: nucleotidyltransferase family protein [Peptococcaceae bacterium]|nr:nucleotidyltransferase family protein [Peptococcaceae bacterium]
MVDALVLAGSRNDGPLRQCSSVPYEAMITIGRKTMIEYVIDALRSSRRIGRIVVVGPPDVPGFCRRDDVSLVPAEGNLMENILRGVENLSGAARVLLATCDIPLITPQAIEDFLDKCGDKSADIYYPVVPREVVEKSYVNTKRTYVTFKEGDFTGGNLFLIASAAVSRCMVKGQQLVDARKSPFRLSRLMGVPFLIKFMLRMVSISEAERKASDLLGIEGAVVITRYPEVGVDVDKPSDLELVSKVLVSA